MLAQEMKIIAYYGTSQKSDTVYFGYKPMATIGLDSLLGEKNIYNTSWNQFEMRVLQRTRDNFSCAYKISFPKDTIPVYFSQSFDSKRNYRQNERIEIDVSKLSNGCYFISVFDTENKLIFSQTIIKQ